MRPGSAARSRYRPQGARTLADQLRGMAIDLSRGETLDIAGVRLTVESCGNRGLRLRAVPPKGFKLGGLLELLAGEYSLTVERVSAQN